MYYLNSRYYDPQTGRFISPEPNVDTAKFDDGVGLHCFNVYAYCGNNPVTYKDVSGEFVISISIGIGSLLTWVAYGIATAVGVGAGVAIGTAVGNNIRRSTTYVDTRSDSKAKEKDRRIKKPAPIYIYRYNGTNPGNLIPMAKDKNTGYEYFSYLSDTLLIPQLRKNYSVIVNDKVVEITYKDCLSKPGIMDKLEGIFGAAA